MRFLYGLDCVATFIGYCAMLFGAVILIAAAVGYLRKGGKK